MKKTLMWAIVGCCLVGLAAQAQAQGTRKPGLYEVSTSMSMTGMPNMPQAGSHTMQVCVTQAMIDKYGGPTSSPQMPNCQTTNVVVTPAGMTANVTCSGKMNMTGKVQTTFVDANTTKATVSITMTSGSQTMTTTTESTYTYKGPDCGSVKPPPVPASQ
ncbi:MAG: DUF3617 family protein [Terracidiphilus sp.]